MAKIVKKKYKRLVAKKDGLTPHLRKVIADGEKDLREGKTVRRSTEEMIQHVWNLLS